MINPQTVDVSALPSVSLSDREHLPETPSIYFAIDSQNTIQYIGRSAHPHHRWKQHHRKSQLSGIDGVRLAYMSVEPNLLPAVESALIEYFDHCLNGRQVPIVPRKSLRTRDTLQMSFQLQALRAK